MAGPAMNLDFSQGLTGWTVSDPSYVTVTNGQATISESATASEVDLYQDFTVPTDSQTISVDLVGVTTDPADLIPAALGISLLDATTLEPVVSTVDIFTDSYYIRDLVDGVTQGEAATNVNLVPSPTAFPLTISVDSTALQGQDVRFLFRVLGSDSEVANASATIDNIVISPNSGGGGTVPEPGMIVIWMVGIIVAGANGLRFAFYKKQPI